MQAEAPKQATAGLLVLAGGALALVAAFLSWLDFEPRGDEATTFKGTDLTAGTGALGLGIVLVILGIVLYIRGGKTGGKGASITAIVLSAFILFAGAYSAISPGDALASFEASSVAEAYDIPQDVAEQAIKAGIEAGDIEVTALIGGWAAALAGLLGLAGGIIGVRKSGEIKAAMPPAPAMAAPPPTTAA